eukprot:CAMPEP_0114661882 /NCGR_PEP_ID=MMETSP0191-20121206/23568_1 /TAXON_ID=126664 /ORGANISM="Sorites sp." /LENGTH=91 /DNA_ID=CAMNT_0001896101 /DNA_START=483 /DNA_END=758 /DNA_ORIENTATION=+
MKRIISASNADGEYTAPKVTLGNDATNMNEIFETDRDSIYGSPTAKSQPNGVTRTAGFVDDNYNRTLETRNSLPSLQDNELSLQITTQEGE